MHMPSFSKVEVLRLSRTYKSTICIFSKQHINFLFVCWLKNSSSLTKGIYKPSFAGFVDVELANKELSLRSLVSFRLFYSLLSLSFLPLYIYIWFCSSSFFAQIDHSVVESFGARGRTCITSRVYPTLAVFSDAHLFVFNNGTESVTVESLDAWSMKTPVMN